MWRGVFLFLHFSFSCFGSDSAVHSADYSRSRDAALAVSVAASFTQSSGPPHSLDRVRNEHIWLAEVGPHVRTRRCRCRVGSDQVVTVVIRSWPARVETTRPPRAHASARCHAASPTA